jgi:sarcosine oxidase gamma subunit
MSEPSDHAKRAVEELTLSQMDNEHVIQSAIDEALKEAVEPLLRLLQEAVADGAFEYGPEGWMIWNNRATKALLEAKSKGWL